MAGIELCKFTHGLGLYIRILPRTEMQLISPFGKKTHRNERPQVVRDDSHNS
jgi:hypothetical protein